MIQIIHLHVRRFNYIFVAKHFINIIFLRIFLTKTCLLGRTELVVVVVIAVVTVDAIVALVLIISHLVT